MTIANPKTVKTTPVAWFNLFGSALLANKAAILAPTKVATTQTIKASIFGIPPIAKCEHAPVNAVNDIYVTEQKFASCINEKIKGNLEFVRNGIMLINDDGELTIYSTNKISSINK